MNYLHIRHYTPEGKMDPRGGFTVAFERNPVDSTMLHFAMAKCSKKDVYNKKRGRQVAEGRLAKRRHLMTVMIPEGKRPVEALVAAVRGVTDNYRILNLE